ncbi:S46 family peptidase [soil metagenome]
MSTKLSRILLPILLFFTFTSTCFADEGMWFPQLLQQLNAPEMRLKGLQIPVEELYSTHKNTLKDAVVLFGGGCTAELISKQGLLLTNHHCGFSQIQDHSSLEHNYLKDGFWAKTFQDEIPCPGLTVTFVISIDDVTAQFNSVLTDEMTESQRNEKIKEIAAQVEKKAIEGNKYDAKVRQFFSGNEFYLILTETFKDIRLVGTPPSSIGKFGGDTDNWMWPRHTGDFSMFRIYANKENGTAEYSADNVPYTPRKSFTINLNGVQEGDFTMVYGFPGRTQEYISSYAINALVTITNPDRVKVRDVRLKIMGDAMRSSELLHIKYAAKQGSISNGWKKWKGESKGILEANGVQRKKEFEIDFQSWADNDPTRKRKYGNLLPSFEKIYTENAPYMMTNDFYSEAMFGIEAVNYTMAFRTLVDLASAEKPDLEKVKIESEKLRKGAADYFKDYDAATDQLMTASLLKMFDQQVADSLKPDYFLALRNRYHTDYTRLAKDFFNQSVFVSQDKIITLLTDFNSSKLKKIKKDPFYELMFEVSDYYKIKITDKMIKMNSSLARLNRYYMEGQREFQPDRKFYPDANSTLRLTYGQVRGYVSRDAVYYNLGSTLDGMMEKYIPGDEEFDLPARLVELYNKKDYGPYGVKGTVPVSFVATNHTTGGNSGSPVLNAFGQLIGTNYDRVWEGTMSDVMFNPEICRNITLDIRFTLFIVDRFAEAQRLMEEMDIIYPH